jgi:hypothetical protein
MQSAQDWATKNAPGAIDGARERRIFARAHLSGRRSHWQRLDARRQVRADAEKKQA